MSIGEHILKKYQRTNKRPKNIINYINYINNYATVKNLTLTEHSLCVGLCVHEFFHKSLPLILKKENKTKTSIIVSVT